MKERTGTVNCMIATIVICIIAELIGPLQFKVMGIDVKILTMIGLSSWEFFYLQHY